MNQHSFSKTRVKQQPDREIQVMEKDFNQKEIIILTKQNSLLKKQLEQLRSIHSQTKKELEIYKKAAYTNGDMGEVLEMQHNKIFQLQTQLQVMSQKYQKVVGQSSSNKQTQYAIKCKQLQKRLQKTETQYQKQIAALKQKLILSNASQILQNKRLTLTPSSQLKRLPLNSKKFV